MLNNIKLKYIYFTLMIIQVILTCLFIIGYTNKINKENFDSKVEKGVVLVDFFANWCMPCKMLSPVLEEASELFGDKVSIYKVDVDKDNELAARFNVMSIPNLILFKDGKAVNQHVGFASKQDIVDFIKTALKSD